MKLTSNCNTGEYLMDDYSELIQRLRQMSPMTIGPDAADVIAALQAERDQLSRDLIDLLGTHHELAEVKAERDALISRIQGQAEPVAVVHFDGREEHCIWLTTVLLGDGTRLYASPPAALTAYGEKVRAAFIKELNRLDYWFSADVLRSMPLPA